MKIDFVNGYFSANVSRYKDGIAFSIETKDDSTRLFTYITDPLAIELLKKECETFLELTKCSEKQK